MSKILVNCLGVVAMALGSSIASAAVALPASAQLQNYQSATAAVSVSGNMSYNTGTASGSANESDSNSSGQLIGVDWQRKGYGYSAFASADSGLVKSYASAIDAGGSGTSSASSSATWTDYFVIFGNNATEPYYNPYYGYTTRYLEGSAILTASVDGSIAGKMSGGAASFSFTVDFSPLEYCYYYYYSCTAADSSQSLVSESKSVSGNRKVSVNDTYETEFSFRYNTPFKITSALSVSAGQGGLADFSHTGSFGLVLPDGAQLVSASGLSYTQAPAVPEPESWALLMAGLVLVGAVLRRRAA